ncbi:alkene reductase [Paraburkholderia silvatlantica]|uniref:N-ethylmaleimide reductase n=1 Tax=Paraburkholderia silvatlantica TaxID=321895 RepID=A0ABR6FFW2_9BURK|nr:alkene reductase [Paraburkholderia silvatlantica]MBB2926277.1 N-ethylmaleimide reductase [Paraburkholderia silvatlantica]PVY26828.1 N-ethylmaleimide reductase [Paraburkholderia silvatlantica]PXW33115.1 N-ethylmaleimide reductase [Paraburkholderia silvatlantica]TDQ80778.1 N-ethylmaleimide reductase [Paraburkholderia silvatlantica]
MKKLFTSAKVGAYTLKHRVVLAPMTRVRTLQPGDIPSPMMADFYGQRASDGGLEIIEAASISVQARSYLGAASIYHDDQHEGWKAIADAVHAKGGRAFLQLIHGGRQSHVDVTGGAHPVAPSVVPFDGVALTKDGFVPASPHRALEIGEIAEIVEDFRRAAERARKAGFDGVELHAANGYLVDQFIQDGTNRRTDAYGGPIGNRVRFLRESLEALISVFGADRVGVRISPSGEWGGISDSNPQATFSHVAKVLDSYGIAYLHVIEPRVKGDDTLHEGHPAVAAAYLRPHFSGPIIAAGGFGRDSAIAIVESGDADLVAFGRHFSSNPDLPFRLQHDLPLTPYVRSAFWGGTEENYSDFPTYEAPQASHRIAEEADDVADTKAA